MEQNKRNPTLHDLERVVRACRRCPLSETRTQAVFGAGKEDGRIMFVGEGPGFHEDRLGKPFVGRAGELLDRMLEAVNLGRDDVYITNIVKCRPPDNRNPLDSECEQCMDYLRWQVKLIDPDIIVCLGAVAARKLIRSNFRITKEHGTWHRKGRFHIMAMYHPAALLRDPSKKRDAWEALQSMEALCGKLSRESEEKHDAGESD